MRTSGLVVAVLACVAHTRRADACCAVGGGTCGYQSYALFTPSPEPSDDATPPSAPVVEVEVIRYDEGCGAHGLDLVLSLEATDDRTQAASLGFVITVARGNLALPDEGAILPLNGPMDYYVSEDELPFEVELEIRAIDLAGNLGPPTLVPVSSEQPTSHGKLATVRGTGPLLGYGLTGLALAFACRRRPTARSSRRRSSTRRHASG